MIWKTKEYKEIVEASKDPKKAVFTGILKQKQIPQTCNVIT